MHYLQIRNCLSRIFTVKIFGEEVEINLLFEITGLHHNNDKYLINVKNKMRNILGENMFNKMEMAFPVMLEIDTIGEEEYIKLFKRLLSNPSNWGEMANLIIYRINISNIVKYIHLIYKKFNERREYQDKFSEFWNLNIPPATQDLFNEDIEIKEIIKIYKLICEILISKYKELIKERKEEGEEEEEVIKIEEKLKLDLRNKIIEIAKNNKKFKEFLDTTRGAKARILEIFEREMDIYEIIFEEENGEDLREIISIEPTEEELLLYIADNYLNLFKAKTKIEKLKTEITADILLNIYENNNYFFEEEEKEWKKLKIIFCYF
uniref:Uncharacterized protein n=1 Tax=Meloidogyne enterolobii TaxID=390850 RepID=A0A6V7XMB6_MELEN|nr:unnamed protein product [Meloidogyne enterolobii]